MTPQYKYEILIRRAWPCERFQKGANTDTYDSFVFDEIHATEHPNNNKFQKAFQKSLGEIKGNLTNAFRRSIERLQKRNATQGEVDRVLDCINQVDNSTNSKELNVAIQHGLTVFEELNIHMNNP